MKAYCISCGSVIRRNRAALLHLTKHDPVKWADMVDRVFAKGAQLLSGGGVAGAGGGALLFGVLAAMAFYFYNRMHKEVA